VAPHNISIIGSSHETGTSRVVLCGLWCCQELKKAFWVGGFGWGGVGVGVGGAVVVAWTQINSPYKKALFGPVPTPKSLNYSFALLNVC
jgi:hypothetical protein